MGLLMPAEGDNVVEYGFWCVACGHLHSFRVLKPNQPKPLYPVWKFENGNLNAPTFTPSLRVFDPHSYDYKQKKFTRTACHLNVTDGKIEYHGDCPHAFAGKAVPMVDIEKT